MAGNLFGGLIKDPYTTAKESIDSINSDMNTLVKECSCPNCGADLDLVVVEPVRLTGRSEFVGIGHTGMVIDVDDEEEEEEDDEVEEEDTESTEEVFEESCDKSEKDTFEESAKPEDEEFEESPIAITVGDKGAQLADQREAIRNKLEQEKTANDNTLAAKRAALEQQRDIIRRQTALKQQQPSPAYQSNTQQPVRQFTNAEGSDEEIEVIEE